MSTARRVRLTVLLGLVGVLLLPAAPAAAHVELSAATPGEGATVTEPVTGVTLEFSGALDPAGDHAVGLFAPDGTRVDRDATVAVSERAVTVEVGELPEAGDYTVRYLVVAADGHALEGEYGFTYAGPVAAPAPAPAGTAEPTDEAPSPAQAGPGSPQPTPGESPAAGGEGGAGAALPIVAALGILAVGAGLLAWRHRNGAA